MGIIGSNAPQNRIIQEPGTSICYTLRHACFNGHIDIVKLLNDVGLPSPGFDDVLVYGFRVEDEPEKLIGCIGWESYDQHVLLRSIAIAKEYAVKTSNEFQGGCCARATCMKYAGAFPYDATQGHHGKKRSCV